MYKILLNNELEKLKSKNIPFNIEAGKFDLFEMHEASSNNPYIDLEGTILIVKKITFYGAFTPNNFNANTTFVKLLSAYNNVDLSNLFTVRQNGNFVEVSSEFASVHEVRFKMFYDLTTFIESNPANIFNASCEFIKIHKLEQ